jgi:tRNA(fMet)-specific endonuclease VapC
MRRYLLDTGIAGDYVNDRNGVRARVKQEMARGNHVGICVPVLAELRYGAENSRDPLGTLQPLARSLPTLRVWPLSVDAAAEYGRLRFRLERIGRPMGQMDILIAAVALTLGNTTVVSADSDLAAVPGLAVENWAATP